MTENPFDREILKWILEAIQKTFDVQLSTKAEMVNVTMNKPVDRAQVGVASVLGIESSKFTGTIAYCFPSQTFITVVNGMLGENFTEVSSANADACGEILNITYGIARNNINNMGHDFTPAIPTVISGKELKIAHAANASVATIHYKSPAGPFYVEFSLKPKA